MRSSREPALKAAGYSYNFDRMAYFNRDARKVFSVEWLEDHPIEDLHRALETPNQSEDWVFYVDEMPPKHVIEALLAEIDGR
jgi:hypothetical protein